MGFFSFLSRGGRRQSHGLKSTSSTYQYGVYGNCSMEGLPAAKQLRDYTPSSTPIHKRIGEFQKGELPGFESDFSIKGPSAYDFLWTIKSFSKLSGSSNNRHATGRFDVQGLSWKLVFYPNGNIVNGQLSLYLMLSKAPSHPSEAIFEVTYELFLFNQITGSTLSCKGENLMQIQDEVGFRNLIDLKSFRDSSKGYLVKDSCMLGVKILQVVPIQTKTECLHPVEKVSHEYTWKIEKFSKLDKKISHEKQFTAGDYLWAIHVYPDGDEGSDYKVSGKNLSLYLYYHGPVIDTPAMKVSAEFTLTIVDQIEGNHKKKTYTEVFKSCQPGWGRKDFMLLEEFYDQKRGFLLNDTCIIEAKVAVIALVK